MKIKEQLCAEIDNNLSRKIEEVNKIIADAKLAKTEDTKSSAGDKYETSREMAQQEIDKAEIQLAQLNTSLIELKKIDCNRVCEKVEFGSLVQTNTGTYFMAISMGKVMVNDEPVYAISMASPIGKALAGKIEGEKVSFQEREILINSVC